MKYLKIRDQKHRKKFQEIELRLFVLRALFKVQFTKICEKMFINCLKKKEKKKIDLLDINFLKIFKNFSIFEKNLKPFFVYKFINICTNFSSFKFKNRCLISNRGMSIYRDFGVSRLMLRKYSSNGMFNGVRKASW
jgi:small subunit ribosomal protein S14